jgi:hypothetical protein
VAVATTFATIMALEPASTSTERVSDPNTGISVCDPNSAGHTRRRSRPLSRRTPG